MPSNNWTHLEDCYSHFSSNPVIMADDPDFNSSQKAQTAKADLLIGNAGGRGLGTRHIQAAVWAVGAFLAYSHRINLSVAIVAMVRHKQDNQTEPIEELAPTFDWDEEKQGYLLSSFFWGYTLLQIPAGIITGKFGGHRFLCFAVIGSSALTILIPQCAIWGGWVLVCINRMCQGFCQGFLFPSIYTLLGVWCPPTETSRMASISLGAQLLGVVATTPIAGYLISIFGWPSVYYSFGTTGVILGIVMIFLGADSPAKHRSISEAERRYIERSLGGAKAKVKVPWTKVLTSPQYLSALQAMTFYSLGYFIMLTEMPTYLKTVLKFSIEKSGLLSALPYLVAYILSLVFSGVCDFVLDRDYVTLTTARKVFNSIAHFGAAASIVAMGHMDNPTLAVVFLCGFMGCQAASFTAVMANFVDLAPNFAGSIFSVGNCSSSLLGIIGPIVVGYIVTESGNAEQWRIVFYLCAALLVISNVLYVILGSAETQWWNWPERYSGKKDYLNDKDNIKNKLASRRSSKFAPRPSFG